LLILGVYYTNPDSYTYQIFNNQHIPAYLALDDDIPNSKYETGLAKNYPFIFWLVENQLTIFFILLSISLWNIIIGFRKRGKIYTLYQKVFK